MRLKFNKNLQNIYISVWEREDYIIMKNEISLHDILSCSTHQGYSIAPKLYSLQAKPFVATVRDYPDFQEIHLPRRIGDCIKTKLNMSADDTQHNNKTE